MKLKTTLLTGLAVSCLQVGLMAQTYTDDFEAFHDYSTGDVTGTIWDGVLNAANLDPGSDTTGGVLHLRNTGEGWENAPFYNGPFLYKLVAGDFNVEVQNIDTDNVDYSDGGLMVRVPTVDDAGPGEDWMTLMRFNSVCCGEPIRVRSCDGGSLTHSGNFPAGQNFLRIERRGTFFKFYGKVNAGDPWALGYTLDRPDLAGLALQVGLQHGTFSANAADRQFDNFSLTLVFGPAITAQPQATKAMIGGSATFSVAATGIEPLEYQWLHAGTNLPGAIDATLTLNNVQLSDAGVYSVLVTDADGSTPSEEATLDVVGAGQLFGDDFNVFHDYTSGDVAGTIWDGVLNAANLDPGSDTTGGVLHWRNTGEGWEGANGSGPVLYKTVSGDFDAEVYMPYISNVQWSDGGIIARLPDNTAGENYVTVKAFGTGSSVGARWAVNGAGGSADMGALKPYIRLRRNGTTFKFYTKANASDAWTLGHTLDRPDMAGDVQLGLWHGTFVGNAADRQFDDFWLHLPAGPVINTQPASQRVFAGQTVSFSVTATGIEPLEYQWQRDGTNLPDAIEATLTLANVQMTDAGTYRVVVTDADGSTESEPATLAVIASLGVLTDDFNRYHDYAGGNVSGTIWDGVLNPENLDPGSDTTGGVLHWRNTGEGFDAPNYANGPFLHKLVTGDFDAEIQVAAVEYAQWSDGGLMARVPNLDDAGPGEDYVAALLFSANNADAWAQVNKIRSVNDNVTGNLSTSGVYGHFFLRLVRLGNVFNFYTKAAAGDNWGLRETFTRNDLPATLQVGLQHGTYSANAVDRQFDNFRLAGPNVVGAISVTRTSDQITLSWEGVNLILQRNGDAANPAGWTDVSEVTGNSVTLPIEAGNAFFRLRTP